MQNESRVKKSLLNAKVNLIFYVLMLFVSFFSRKIFLERLGDDFVGLTGTLQNIMGLLNLAELGVGAAVSYALYKPIQEGNKDVINEIVSVFGCLYRYIGLFVLGAALVLSCFIPLIFKQTVFDLGIIYFAFFAFLSSSLLSYFINYRQILLVADQKNYVVAAYYQTSNILKAFIQIAIAYYTANFFAWVAIELCYGFVYAYILNKKIKQTYPWLQASVSLGKRERYKYPEIVRKTKQVFVHKIKDFLLSQSDQILVFAFVSLKMVAFYGNYTLIITKITALFTTTLDGMAAGVGNLIAEGDKTRIFKVFWELVFVRYFIGGIVVFGVFHCIEPFISLWLGKEYLLDSSILILLIVYTFVMLTRGAVDLFNAGYGNYHDVWSAWAEGIINITVTLIAAPSLGISGILLGKIASIIPIVVFWKPIFLYRSGFRSSVWPYWKGISLNLLAFLAAFLPLHMAASYLPIDPYHSFLHWMAYALLLTGAFVLCYFIALYILTPGARTMCARLPLFNRKR